jgi:hypothetical protein
MYLKSQPLLPTEHERDEKMSNITALSIYPWKALEA